MQNTDERQEMGFCGATKSRLRAGWGGFRMRLVLVEWEDSARPVPEWVWASAHTWEQVVKCRSVGWLVYDGADVKALAPNVGDEEGEDHQYCGVIRIPARCITAMRDLA